MNARKNNPGTDIVTIELTLDEVQMLNELAVLQAYQAMPSGSDEEAFFDRLTDELSELY